MKVLQQGISIYTSALFRNEFFGSLTFKSITIKIKYAVSGVTLFLNHSPF